MKRSFPIICILSILISGCFRSDQSKIKERLRNLADDLSYSSATISPIRLAFTTNNLVKEYFTYTLDLKLKVQGAEFHLRNDRDLKQYLMLMRKYAKSLKIKFNNVKVTKNGEGHNVRTTIFATGKNQKGEEIEEFLDYEFYFLEIEDKFMISSGLNIKTMPDPV